MVNYKTIDKIIEICSWMEDETSRIILKERLLYSLTNDIRYIYDMLKLTGFTLKQLEGKYDSEVKEYYGDLYPDEDLLTWLLKKEDSKIVVFGCGNKASEIVSYLNAFNIPIFAFADNYKSGEFCGKPVFSVESIPKDALIIISSFIYQDAMYKQLIELGYYQENIFSLCENALFCPCGTSYLDETIFEPRDEELFVDGGAFHGETSRKFAKWAKSYKGIIAFEPETMKLDICKKTFMQAGLHDVTLMNAGLWSRDGYLSFESCGLEGAGSKFCEKGKTNVEVRALDCVIKDRVSFIKMDIEGSELEALKGAKETIQRDKPRLAICLYHKPQDIWEIPQYIKKMVPQYHMAVRHYMTNMYDTVLYCWI